MTVTFNPDAFEPREIPLDEVTRRTQANLPLSIPWHPNKVIPLGTFYHSDKLHDPWSKTSPFDTASLASTPIIVSRDYGSESIFKSHSTSRSTETSDHLELGFGVGVGLPFLASVTVQGSYCKDVQENKDTSVNFSTRAGSVSFERQPRFTHDAIITIKYNGGLEAFHQRFGDYYLAAYRLGGDTGILVSSGSSHKRELEQFGITVTADVLFVSESITHTKDLLETADTSDIKFMGYDTLGHTTYNSAAQDTDSSSDLVRQRASELCEKATTLDVRVSDKLDELDIHDGDCVDEAMCKSLVESGLVVEFMLLPASSIREVRHWMVEDDVI